MAQVTIIGLVATTPRHITTVEGIPITSFRFVETKGNTSNWYTATAFNALAINAKASISKGDRIIVVGEINVRDWDNGERSGTSVELEAIALGHDQSFGSSVFTRTSWNGNTIADPSTLKDTGEEEGNEN